MCKNRNSAKWNQFLTVTVLSLALAGITGCGTDSDVDGPIDVADGISQDTHDLVLEDLVDSDTTNGDALEDLSDVGDLADMDDLDAEDAEDADSVGDVDDTDTGDTSDITEPDADVSDTEDTTDLSDVDDDGSTLGNPCVSHCACNSGQYCDNASGTCQPIIIDLGYYCCSDPDPECPNGETCDLDDDSGNTGTCGE